MALLSNHGTPSAQRGMFDGVAQAGLTAATYRKKEKQAERERNATVDWLRARHPDLAEAVTAGLPMSQAFTEGFQRDEEARKAKLGYGGDPTSSMREYNLAKSQGYNGTFMDFLGSSSGSGGLGRRAPNLETFYDEETGREFKGYLDPQTMQPVRVGGIKAAGGSGGAGGEQLPAEMGARIGMGDAYLDDYRRQDPNNPGIRERVEGGIFDGDTAGGLGNRAGLALGVGPGAEIWRAVETGRDALVRNLTGAGMSVSEAQNQAARYQIQPNDSRETILDKLDRLERDLEATREGAISARRGTLGSRASGGGSSTSGGSTGRTSSGLSWSVN
ncbi:hypothetical protein [Antarcticirhabdus aurantiaca]|uniref:hypothetical protein n=1 Tax=Antarcticirhabdus aurantiaca TaxID=2606717 RepID=UPI001AEEC6B0|nr:hypothetical protein [Antarcticirhabdus aurantiaca]